MYNIVHKNNKILFITKEPIKNMSAGLQVIQVGSLPPKTKDQKYIIQQGQITTASI